MNILYMIKTYWK